MTGRRSLARLRRRLARPTFGRLVVASIALHLAALAVTLSLTAPGWTPPPPPRAPLIVELPPAAPGTPFVRPEVPRPPARGATPPSTLAARPAPATPPPSPPLARPTPPETPNAQPPSASVAVPPSPPPAPAPSAPVAPPAPEAGPTVAAKPPEPTAPTRPSEPPAAPESPALPSIPAESPFAGRRFSLLGPRLEPPPPLPAPPPSGSGGTRTEGSGAGESGVEREGQATIPLNTADPRYTEYFLEIKKRIEAKWVYPQEAVRRNQSGQGALEFVLRKDGTVRIVEIVHSSGVGILDSYVKNAVWLAAPFPPIPDRVGTDSLPISINFTYVLGGIRVFGFR